MRSFLTSGWTAPAPSAVPSFSNQLAVTVVSIVFAIGVHATVMVLGI